MEINKDNVNDFGVILQEMELIEPRLAFTCWEVLKKKEKIDEAISRMDDMVNSNSPELLKKLLKIGFIPKCRLENLYYSIDFNTDSDTSFWMAVYCWKMSNFEFAPNDWFLQ